jgi:hypothetical protein
VVQTDQLATPAWAPGRVAIFALGAVLLALFVAGAVIAQTEGSETRKTTPEAKTTTTSSGEAKKEASGPTTSTTTSGAITETETRTTTPQEGVLLALLATGALLVLVGALYSRITTIKVPGGGELVLSPEETKAVSDTIETTVAAGAPAADVARATSAAVLLADTHKRIAAKPLEQADFDAIAAEALRSTGVPAK